MPLTRREALRVGALAGASTALGALPGCRLFRTVRPRTDEVTIGAVGLFPAEGRLFKGELPEIALAAALGEINARGGVLGRRVVYRGAQAGSDTEALDGYRRLAADPSVIGVVLATPLGAQEIVDEAARTRLPLIVAGADLTGAGGLWPQARDRRSVFQFALPDAWLMEAVTDYLGRDRSYRTAGLIYDDFSFPEAERQFQPAAAAAGLKVSQAEQFGRGQRDLAEQLRSFRSTGCESLVCWALPDLTAEVAKVLASDEARYVDTPTAKSGAGWHPQLAGCPAGMFEPDWIGVAEDAAATGSVTPGDIGAFRLGPRWLLQEWGDRFVADWDRGSRIRRGQRAIADAAYAFVEAASRRGSLERDAVIEGLESGKDFQFCSTPFGFTPEDHVALARTDVALFTLERTDPAPATPPYSSGLEFKDKLTQSPGMTLLVRPRFATLSEHHPRLMPGIREGGYGTACALEPGGSLGPRCSIH